MSIHSKSAIVPLQLFDPRQSDAAFKIAPIEGNKELLRPHRVNYFTVLWIEAGQGLFHLDLNEHPFTAPVLIFINPYQTFFAEPGLAWHGISLQFHANFFCIETYHEEIGCNGVLFNDVYGRPIIQPEGPLALELGGLISQMEKELKNAGLAHSEILISYLKVFLIKATRCKLDQQKCPIALAETRKPVVVERLVELIEMHYQEMHAPSDYAALLSITPKALGKIVKTHFGKTLTELIRDRILKHVKWQLLHTRRSIKEIASEAGFNDELYFSRLFKRATGFSPTSFREFETSVRGGRNLSM